MAPAAGLVELAHDVVYRNADASKAKDLADHLGEVPERFGAVLGEEEGATRPFSKARR